MKPSQQRLSRSLLSPTSDQVRCLSCLGTSVCIIFGACTKQVPTLQFRRTLSSYFIAYIALALPNVETPSIRSTIR